MSAAVIQRCHKCQVCNKKINTISVITGTCRCKQIFCSKHILDHNCTFDYKEDYKMNNKLVKLTTEKIETLY
jgi:hypothetical protein